MSLNEKIAVGVVSLSWLIFAGIFLLPFVPVQHDKLLVAAVVYVVSQVVFWTGCALGGREVMRRYRVNRLVKKWLCRRRKDRGQQQDAQKARQQGPRD